MNKILALYDSDIFYATRFMEYFIRKNNTGFEISVFTRKDSLEEFLSTNYIEILLLGSDLMLEEPALQNIRHSYYLSDAKSFDVDNAMIRINKYQAVSSLVEEIIQDYSRKENLIQGNKNMVNMNIISVFSPIGGKEKVLFTWALSYLISEHKRTLLVILDLIPATVITPMNQQGQCLTDFIYYLKENPGVDKIKNLVRNCGNLSVLSGLLHGADILSLTKEDIQEWSNELRSDSEYETVIFYLGCYTEATIELMNLSNEVIVTAENNPYEMAVVEEWQRQMIQVGINTNQDKYRIVQVCRGENTGDLPLSIQELMESSSWAVAEQYLNY